MRREGEVDKRRIRNDVGIEIDLEALGMVADAMIGRVRYTAARVTDARSPDSFDNPEPGVRSPESTHAERGGCQRRRHECVERR